MNINPTAEWTQLYDRYYRKREVYTLLWDRIDLSRFSVTGAPFGGPIAMIRDEKKILMVNQGSLKPTFFIYTSAGKLLSSFEWNKGRLVGIGWNENEKLVCVTEDGNVLLYTIFGQLYSQFHMGKEATTEGIIECKIWGGGLVCLTGRFQFISVSNWIEPRPKLLAVTGLMTPPKCWTIIEPQYTPSQSVEVFVATQSGTVLLVDMLHAQDQLLSMGPFTKMTVSPNGKLLACFTESGILWVMPVDFSKNLSQFDTKSKTPPEQMVWCGTDSVLLYWEGLLLMVGPFADWVKYTYDVPIMLIPECDGVRIITNNTCEFLQRVPDVIEDIFKIGSTAPSAILFDALDHFEKRSPKADENIRSIKNELVEAVENCIEAAGQESTPYLQRNLLKAASFGKSFLDNFDSQSFVEMCKILRVVNAVNYYEVGIPLTYQQYKLLGPIGLIDRLINQNQHLLAWRICHYLKLRGDRVLVHWACAKVMVKKTIESDSEICETIVKKLQDIPGISYAEIASTAYKAGKIELATKLLDYEPRAADQVPLLISMHQEEVALSKAIDSGDTDLVYLVLLHIKRIRSPQDFFRIIKSKPLALDLLISYSKQQDLSLLKDLYLQLDQIQETANITVFEAYQADDIDKRLDLLQDAHNYYVEAKDVFTSKTTEEQIKLMLLQKELESSLGSNWQGDSLSETLFKLIKLDQSKRVAKIKSDFKIPDKRFYWVKLKAIASIPDWSGLEKFAKEKKSPIGYGPFVDICVQHNSPREAEKYIQYIKEPVEKVDKMLLLGLYADAAEVAKQAKNVDLLVTVRNKCKDTKVVAFIDNLLMQLTSK